MRDEERDARSSRGLSSSAKITASGVGTRPLLTLCTILSAHGEHDWNFLGVALLNSTWSGRVEWVEGRDQGGMLIYLWNLFGGLILIIKLELVY